MAAGALGPVRQWAIRHQLAIGAFFDAENFVEVGQAHIMADTEATGEAGVAFVERLAAAPAAHRRVRVPTLTDPRGVDFAAYERLGQTGAMAAIEARLIRAFEALGVLMTNTCINYQTILPPARGEHLALGDTGVVIYANAVQGARSNFEGGPSALAAALTGRTPRYGFHLDRHRAGTRHFALAAASPADLSGWGVLGGVVGQRTDSYWEVPVLTGLRRAPSSDELKHFGAALASFGSVAMFHIPGATPEAPTLEQAFTAPVPRAQTLGEADLAAFTAAFDARGDKVDVVVFAAPQLSLLELDRLAGLLDGRRVHPKTTLIAATSPEIKSAADRMGLTDRIEAAGGILLAGVCFYQSYAREMAEANGWQCLLTNSAKLVNIIGGYGYRPSLATTERCVDSAVAGRIV